MQKGSFMQNEANSTGATAPAVIGQSVPTDANTVTGEKALSPAEQGAAAMRAEFESLIKGRFKELYDERVGGAVKRRLRGMSAQVKRLEALSPTLRSFAAAHGIDDGDTEALKRALSEALGHPAATGTGEDNNTGADRLPSPRGYDSAESTDTDTGDSAVSSGESTGSRNAADGSETGDNTGAAACDKGTNTDAAARSDELHADTAASGERADNCGGLDAQALRRAHGWAEEARDVAQLYPDFDLRTEISSPRFRSLLRGGAGVRDAYEVVHRDELLPAAMRSAALSAVNKLTDSIAAGTVRPAENGVSAALPYACGVGEMTRAERDDLARRVARGERIVL